MENNNFIKNDPKRKKSKWTSEQENLLAEWAEKAACYRWLHSKSEKIYTKSHYRYSIPIIILSTLTGTANFGIDSVPKDYLKLAQMGIGGVNLFAGILGTLQNFFRYAELMEAHRSVEILWSKFQREISVELALDPLRRKHSDEFLAISRSQFDKLIEQSPPIPDSIITLFKKTFKKNTDIRKPDICNGIDPCGIYRPSKEEKIGNVIAFASNKFKSKSTIIPKIENKMTDFQNARKNLSLHLNNSSIDLKNNIFKQIDKNSLTGVKENISLELKDMKNIVDKKEDNIIDNIIDKDIENP